MPMKKKTTKRKAAPRKRQYSGYRRKARASTSQSQVFSETYKAGTECAGITATGTVDIAALSNGQGVKLVTQMNRVFQSNNYASLYQSYKIIKAKFTIVPKWTGEAYNEAAIGTAGAIGITETPRFCYAINDLATDVNAPLTELEVLNDNGCRIRLFNKPLSITIRPKPVLSMESAANPSLPFVNVANKTNPWIEFDGSGTLVPHVGVDGFFSAVNSLQAGFLAVADVYVTVSFVCKDPR